jgi:putative membrane-bound dehydrogenase-like protein
MRCGHVLVMVAALLTVAGPVAAVAAPEEAPAGMGRTDVTPTFHVRLSGFGFRRTESEGVTQRLWAKALAIGDKKPVVLITVDNLTIPAAIVAEVARRLGPRGVAADHLTITATHTHTAPMLSGTGATLFGVPIPEEHQKHIDQYTRAFVDGLEKAALAALADRRPARLFWGVGTVGFARNRRTPGGPVDHDLPLLAVRDPDGKLRAVWVSYACHCVTLSNNKVSGDWAGFAQEAIETALPGTTALVSIGCGGDSNPDSGVSGDKTDIAALQGREIAAEVNRLLAGPLSPLTGPPTVRSERFDLPLADIPPRAVWAERAKKTDAVGYHARLQLARLDGGEALRDRIGYRVQSWTFGDALAVVFLPGEVVVDYSQRLKRELDGRRLWINAYADDVPCYIPSERVLSEGGYEGGGAMIYYDIPVPLRPGLEEKIIAAIHRQLGKTFTAPFDGSRTAGSRPLSPRQSQAAIRTRPGLVVDLVASEPLVGSPVAIDFGPDGRLWVAEMYDYPTGLDGKFRPGGRVRVLEDTDGDGIFDKSTVFLDNIPFPTGVTVWRKGVLVCAAPDILYAEDTDGDGKADKVEKLYSGFGTDNYQARVNSLTYGLDGWVYGSCGLFGGRILSHRTGKVLELGDRDFRIRPDSGEIEPASGQTQQGRVRDDWDNWFGCDNTDLCRHYALADHYLRRNPNSAPPNPAVHVPDYPDSGRLYPARKVQMFPSSGPPNHVTAGCGMGVYRDDLLCTELYGDVFTCDAVNLVVHRLKLTPRGSTFSGRRVKDEQTSEFFATTDNWSRPVQVRTGPDGALYVVDMYRFMIEHPRFIPPQTLAQLDVRAGASMGRIYRIRPADRPLRRIPRLDKFDTAGLVSAFNTPNGTLRDLIGQMLLWREDTSTATPLAKLADEAEHPEVRVHALAILNAIGQLTGGEVQRRLADRHPGVRRHAVRLAESYLTWPEVARAVADLRNDADAQVRLQVAYTLGAWRDRRAGAALANLILAHPDDELLLAAVLSSVHENNIGEVLSRLFAAPSHPEAATAQVLRVAAATLQGKALDDVVEQLTQAKDGAISRWQMAALTGLFDPATRRGGPVSELTPRTWVGLRKVLRHAMSVAQSSDAPEANRLVAVRLVANALEGTDREPLFLELLRPQNPVAVQSAALAALGRSEGAATARRMIEGWRSYTPTVRGQLLDLLLSRDACLLELLVAIEKGTVPASGIDAARRSRLLGHKDRIVRSRAEKVFTATVADRHKVLEAYADVVTLKGNVQRGKVVFGKVCSVCHRLDGVGHEVGPDLTAVVTKSPAYLLQEVLDPNRNVDSRYQEYVAVTQRGRTFTGLLAAETATSITLRGPEGKEQVLLRKEIDELSSAGKSLMPEGLEKDISKSDMADLLSYLATVALPPKHFDGNVPAVVRPKDGALALLATNAAIHGGEISFESEFRNIGMWHGVDDRAVWTVEVDHENKYDVWLDFACATETSGNAYVLEGGRPEVRGKVPATGSWDRYHQQKVGTVMLSAGSHRLTFRADGPFRGALIDLRGIFLVPLGQRPTFR